MFQLIFTVITRLLVQFNSSINPIVYATTVPEFKKTICKLRGKDEETDSYLTQTQKSNNQPKSSTTQNF